MTQLTELDYESIENAVMETARGRWFLAEHKKRQSDTNAGSTPALLDAISRLEKVITSIGSDFSPQMELKAPETQETAPTLEAVLESTPEPTIDNTPLKDENLQFFANDEDLFADDNNSQLPDSISAKEFENAETPAPENKTSVSFKVSELKPKKPAGDRFKIFKMEKTGSPVETPAPELEPASVTTSDNASELASEQSEPSKPAVFSATEIPDPTLAPTAQEQDRIVVIRKTDNNDMDIPLANDFTQELDNLSAKEN